MVVITVYFHPEGAIMEATDASNGQRALRALTGKTTAKLSDYMRNLCLKIPAFAGRGLAPEAFTKRPRKKRK